MNIDTWKESVIVTFAAFIVPLIIGAIFKYTSIGSVGPIVLFYSLFCILVFSSVYIKALLVNLHVYVAIPLGFLLGVIVSVLLLNFFILVTYVLGIHDYQPM